MNNNELREIARRAMLQHGLQPDFTSAATAAARRDPARPRADAAPAIRDLRDLLWGSIDNDDSRDLDQLSVAQPRCGRRASRSSSPSPTSTRSSQNGSRDRRARAGQHDVGLHGGRRLPDAAGEALDRPDVAERGRGSARDRRRDGHRRATARSRRPTIYRAVVRNHAKLAYNSVAAWLDGTAPRRRSSPRLPGCDEQLRLQDRVAKALKARRASARRARASNARSAAVFDDGTLDRPAPGRRRTAAKELIEDFMIAANGVTARFLEAARLRVAAPRAAHAGALGPDRRARGASSASRCRPTPDAAALDAFLREAPRGRSGALPRSVARRSSSCWARASMSLEMPGQRADGHFGLAVERLHALDGAEPPLPRPHHAAPAEGRARRRAPRRTATTSSPRSPQHCTEQEDNAAKVERQVRKSAAALLLASRIGEHFDGIVTGASDKGTWVRISHPTAEGRVVRGFEGLDVGDRVRVKLVRTDVGARLHRLRRKPLALSSRDPNRVEIELVRLSRPPKIRRDEPNPAVRRTS